MSGVLLDTNILSELARPMPEPRVVAFVRGLDKALLSVITIEELRFGIARLSRGRKKDHLTAAINELIAGYGDAVLPVGTREAERSAVMRATQEASGRRIHLADALIAATALEHELTLATRNTKDFMRLGLEVVDPWNR